MPQVVSKKRVADHGEVFTRKREVKAMLNLVKQESERIESRFLEPACGTGNFLVEVLARKLCVVEDRYKRSQSDYERYAFLAASSLYGVELLQDNITSCRDRLFEQFEQCYTRLYRKKAKESFQRIIRFLLKKNIIRGDALSLQTLEEPPRAIVFSEWSFVRGNQIKRRDFAFQELLTEDTGLSLFPSNAPKSDEGKSVFIPRPLKDYPICHFMKIADAD